MRLSKIILGEILEYIPEFETEIDKVKQQGGKYLGSGDYGSAYKLNGKVVKITTDEVEIEHALKLKGKKTNNFVFIHDVEVINDKLGKITMDLMKKHKGE